MQLSSRAARWRKTTLNFAPRPSANGKFGASGPPTIVTGKIHRDDFDEFAKLYHLYVQWQCAEQIAEVGANARRNDTALYLDFPIGVNRDGYDVWRHQSLFALGINGGAPPDGLFVKGQNWGFSPLHPEAIRQQGYRYYIDCLRHHMGSAGMLRIDHVMGLHRAFWVPDGFSATDGVYVHHRAPEFYAILNLESHRHQVQIVGENLGTVPAQVNQTMAQRRFLGMHVGQFGVSTDPDNALSVVPTDVVASLNTHDTATFMGFWQGDDIDDHVALGLASADQADQERRYRRAQKDALIAYLRAFGHMGDDYFAQRGSRWLARFSRRTKRRVSIDQFGRSLARSCAAKCSRHLDGAAQLAAQGPLFFSRNS